MVKKFKHAPQEGKPGRCSMAQVFGPDGNSVATFDPTEDPSVASSYAMLLALTLTDGLRQIE
ncbi:MAG: hypothetical protein V7786_02090 [Sulfitobacter litoralis]|uniref:hypothetical protein n=1 Tax=Sulfitobacter litoralis TaxID=335975 RepID=UPI0030012DD6